MWHFRRPARIMTQDETVLLVRETPINYVDGLAVPVNIGDPVELICNVQPLGTRDLMMLPEGERDEEQFWLFVPETAAIVPQLNDKIVRPPSLYQVQAVRNWETFQKVRIRRVDTGTYGDDTQPYVAHV